MERIKTSRDAKELLEQLHRSTGIRRNMWCRAALGLSLCLPYSSHNEEKSDSDGMELSRQMLFGDDEPTLLGLLRQRHKGSLEPDHLGKIVKYHIEQGLKSIREEYHRQNRRGDELLLWMVQQATHPQNALSETKGHFSSSTPTAGSCSVKIKLGSIVGASTPVYFPINGPGISPHIAIIGRNGTGKTRTGLTLLSQLVSECEYRIPFLIFDYAKGDIASNSEFVKATECKTISLPSETVPIAPLAIARTDEHSIILAAHRFRDTLESVVTGLGPKQKSRCLEIIKNSYEDMEEGTPDLEDIVRVAEQMYRENDLQEDSLIACLREMTDLTLFRSARNGMGHDFFRMSYIVDIHRLPEDLRKLTVFLMLDRLYSEIMTLKDAPIDENGNRQLRLIIVIDEAHHYLMCRQPTLENMVREVRSKGVAIWLFSQSPDDFDQPKYNFSRELGLAIVFSCVLERPKILEAVLGSKLDPKRLSQLPAGVGLTRIPGTHGPVEIRAWS